MNPNLELNWKNWKHITNLIHLRKIRERIETIGGIVCGQRGEWTLILVRETKRHSVRNRKAFSSSILIPMHLTISMSLSIFVSLFLCICLSMKSKSFKTWFISLFLMLNRCDVHRSTSFSVSFSVCLIRSLFHRLSPHSPLRAFSVYRFAKVLGLQNCFLKLFDFITSLSLLLALCTHRLSLFLSWCTSRFNWLFI